MTLAIFCECVRQAVGEKVAARLKKSVERFARLATGAGYKDARSLAAKLYKLAARYPAATHFRWRT